eukprot:COSAG05_NODE_1545_length_4590_cov_2.623692_2_plen_201_part_00
MAPTTTTTTTIPCLRPSSHGCVWSGWLSCKCVELARLRYLLFVQRLAIFTVVAATGLGLALWLGAESIYGLFTTSHETVVLCRAVTPIVLANVVCNIGGAVIAGMIYAAQEFRWLTAINIAVQFAVYLPAIVLAEHGVFGRDQATGQVGLLQLMIPDLLQALCVIACQLMLVGTKVRRELLATTDASDIQQRDHPPAVNS